MDSSHRTHINKTNHSNDGIAVKLKLNNRINKNCNILEIILNSTLLYSKVTLINTNNTHMNGIVLENNYIYFDNISTYCEPGTYIYIYYEKVSPNSVFHYKKIFIRDISTSIEFTRRLKISLINVSIVLELQYNIYIRYSKIRRI